jgi:hypothetical protein
MLNQYLDVFASLHRRKVRYLTIGGMAAIMHGVPRMTMDLDLLIEATPENARLLLDAFEDAHLGTALLTSAEGILNQEITIFNDRVRVDVQTRTPGIAFEDAWDRRITKDFRGEAIELVSKADLVASKGAAGRPIDQQVVRVLEDLEGS